MHSYICTTCGQAYTPAETPPDACPICRDERQYINPQGQAWTTLEDLQKTHRSDIRAQEPGLFGIGATPSIAIGQRALFIAQPGGGVLWDCTPLLTDEAIAQIGVLGGLRAIAISHPHYYASMVDWSRAFGGVPIYIHADDAAHITRPDPAIVLWQGETHDLGQGLTIVRLGGHFAGGSVLHWAGGQQGRGAPLSGDIVTVVPDTRYVGFMDSYPNLLPLPARQVRDMAARPRPHPVRRGLGGRGDRRPRQDGKARFRASVERYIAALS